MHKDTNCSKLCEYCGAAFFRDKRNTWAYWEKARFCSKTCSSKHGKLKIREKVPDLKTAFFKKAIVGKENDCWRWAGVKDKDGYAILSFDKKVYRANRAALIISGIDIPKGYYACHKCGNAWCCNPSHIYAGSPTQNSSDKIMHGTFRKGEKIYCSKLTEEAVQEIRKSSKSIRDLSEQYGVSRSAIYLAQKCKTWRHIK